MMCKNKIFVFKILFCLELLLNLIVMGTLIRILIMLLLLVFAYNYFVGDEEEKKSTETVISNAKDLISSIGTVIKSEKEKYNDGKYDNAIDKLGNLFTAIQSNFGFHGSDPDKKLEKLEREKLEIEQEYLKLENEPDSVRETKKEELNRRLEELLSDAEKVLEKLERKKE